MSSDDSEGGPEYITITSLPRALLRRPVIRLLRVLAVGGARSMTVLLGRDPLLIGRQGSSTGFLAVPDAEVSRRHAELRLDEVAGGWCIFDLRSRNGTYVNGLRTERARLVDQAVIRVGRTLLLYLEEEAREEEPIADLSPRILGPSPDMLEVQARITAVAARDLPVLVTGETGVGKELVAEEIHRRSGRPGKLVPVNCAAVAAALAESELFGHVRGAFTGATEASAGLFAAADRGTLFLDEVGEMPAELQPKLLRALATGEVRAVGSSSLRHVDVRAIAATNRDLASCVAAGTFRADLYTRLAGYPIAIPPLRRRREDILPIATAFLAARQGPALSVDAAQALLLHDWPGNVRELERTLEVAIVHAGDKQEILPSHLPPVVAARSGVTSPSPDATGPDAPQPLAPRDVVPTREQLREVFERLGGNVSKVARHFGKDRQQIYRWATALGIDPARFRK